MKIQKLDSSDYQKITALVASVIQAQGLKAEFYWPEEMLGEELDMTENFGMVKGGTLVGVVLYRILPMAWEISLVATSPQFRRQGLMELLLGHMINAKSQGMELWLEVHENNVSAQKLYEKLGFTKTGVRTKYYKDGASAFLYSHA